MSRVTAHKNGKSETAEEKKTSFLNLTATYLIKRVRLNFGNIKPCFG